MFFTKRREMALHELKYKYREVLDKFVERIKFVHPDIISYIAFVVALIIGILYYRAGNTPIFLIVNIILILLRMTLNTMDGLIALKIDRTSRKGKIVNNLPDKYADMFYLFGISFSSLCSINIGMFATVTVLLVSYSGMLGKALGVSWQQHGPLDKVDRLVFVMVFSLVQFILIKLHPSWLQNCRFTMMEICMIIFIVLGQLTVIRRVVGMVKEINKIESSNTK
jgi:CDP-diacylglycerol--glycerol-3-phosphate 3-phosphatidyltransferase